MEKIKSPRNSEEAVIKRTLPGVRHGRHCIFMMHVHLVFVSKYRKKLFTKEILNFMETIFKDVCNDFGSELKEFNGEGDHVHLLINYPPKVAVSNLVNSLKGVSSRHIRKQQFPGLHKFIWMDSLWSGSYFAGSCGGAPLEIIKQYIEQQ
jgi:putative transposase